MGAECDGRSVGLFGGDALVDPSVDGPAADSDGDGDRVDGGASGLGGDWFEGEAVADWAAHRATSATVVARVASWSRWSTALWAAAALRKSALGSASRMSSQWAR